MLIEENKKWLKIFIPTFIILLSVVVAILMAMDKGTFTNSDEKARVLYNKALIAWTQNQPLEALALLDEVIEQFPETKTASEAILTRQDYENSYSERFSNEKNAQNNKHHFAHAVWKSVLLYKQENGKFPSQLSKTKIGKIEDLQQFLQLCHYQLSPRHSNEAALDCSAANAPFMIYNADTGKYGEYTDYRKARSKKVAKKPKEGQPLSHFLKANTTWGDTLNKGGQIPKQGFSAFFINTNEPEKVIAKYDSDVISMNYAYKDFHNIPSEDFGGYWVGYLTVPKDGNYRFSLNQSWAKSRILLDKRIIFEGRNGGEVGFVYLPKGQYLLEFEYINNWHTVGVQLTVSPEIKIFNDQEIIPMLRDLPADIEVYVAAVYESSDTENKITVDTKQITAPYILLLSSYNAVHWIIDGPSPEVILYQQSGIGSTVNTSGGKVFPWNSESRISYSHFLKNRNREGCHCTAGHFTCENNDASLKAADGFVKRITGRALTGGSGSYGAKILVIPDVKINQKTLQQDQLAIEKFEAERKACIKKNSPDFETMMKQ